MGECPGKSPAVSPPPDAKQGGEPDGRTYPGAPMARPPLPQPRARRPPRRLRAELSSQSSDRNLAAPPGPASRPPAPL